MGFQKIVHKKIGRGMGSVYNSRSLSASLKSFSLQSLWKTGLWLLDLHWKAFITSFALLQKLSDLSESSQSIYTRPNIMQRIKVLERKRAKKKGGNICWKYAGKKEEENSLFFLTKKVAKPYVCKEKSQTRWQNMLEKNLPHKKSWQNLTCVKKRAKKGGKMC